MQVRVDAAVAAVAASQCGVFSRAQALGCGSSSALVQRRCRAGRWRRVANGVYALPGAPDTHLHRLWISHLAVGTGSVVSHESAAALHRLTGFPPRPRVLTVPHSGHQKVADTVVHQITDLRPTSCVRISGLPVTNVARTITDLVAVTRVGRLTAALDDAVVTKRLTTYGAIAEEVGAVARRGKPRIRTLMALLDERGPGAIPPQSKLEQLLFALIVEYDLPEPRRQFPFPGRVFTTGCVDAAYVDAKLIIEVDGRRWHTRIRDVARDHHRDQEASRAGWDTLRILYETVRDEPAWTADLIGETRQTRLVQLGVGLPRPASGR